MDFTIYSQSKRSGQEVRSKAPLGVFVFYIWGIFGRSKEGA